MYSIQKKFRFSALQKSQNPKMGRIKVKGDEVISNLSKSIEEFHGKHLVNRRKVEVPTVPEFKTMLEKLTD